MCTVDGCNVAAVCRGMCQRHYRRFKRYGNPLAGRVSPREARAFVEHLCRLPKSQDCVLWLYNTDKDGYAKLGNDRVCRIICETVHGPAQNKTDHSAHSCGKGMQGCVAWWHLGWKTLSENNGDKVSHGTSGKGAKNPNARLTASEHLEIYQSTDGAVILAKRFGVHRSTIYHIRSGKTWRM